MTIWGGKEFVSESYRVRVESLLLLMLGLMYSGGEQGVCDGEIWVLGASVVSGEGGRGA